MSISTKNREALTTEQVKNIIRYASTKKNGRQLAMMMALSFYVGLRRCQFSKLQIMDIIDRKGNIKDAIILPPSKNKGQDFATYYLPKNIQASLKEYIAGWDITDKERYLFISPKTYEPYNTTSITNAFTKLFKELGYEGLSTHMGRHFYITEKLNKGISIELVKQLVNHKNIQTTSLYAIPTPDVLKKIVNL